MHRMDNSKKIAKIREKMLLGKSKKSKKQKKHKERNDKGLIRHSRYK